MGGRTTREIRMPEVVPLNSGEFSDDSGESGNGQIALPNSRILGRRERFSLNSGEFNYDDSGEFSYDSGEFSYDSGEFSYESGQSSSGSKTAEIGRRRLN